MSSPISPSTSAIQARAVAMAAARLRINAPRETPMAAKAALQATPPAREGGLQVAEVVQRAGEAQPAFVDDHRLVDGLGDLAEQVAGDQDGAALVGQVAQQTAQPRHASRVQPVGRFVKQQHWRVAEQRPGQAEALAHPEG
jgi:hypothetical protein